MSSSLGDPSDKMPWFRSFNRKMKNSERENTKRQKQAARDADKGTTSTKKPTGEKPV